MFKRLAIFALILVLGFSLGLAYWKLAQKGYLPHPMPAKPSPVPKIVKRAEKAEPTEFSKTVGAVSPSVVNISTVKLIGHDTAYTEDPFYDFFNDFLGPFNEEDTKRKWREQGLGSGVIVSQDGYIITNNHVVSDTEKIKVTLFDKRVYYGRVIGADPKTDLAVVKIDSSGLPTVPWGDSDSLSVGEFVLAIGNPFGLSHTVTMGIVSAVGRADVGIADYEDFIQTDAAINPGNSGGPLVDIRGNLIGINTAIFSKSGGYQGIGFAVPSNMARLIMEHLIRDGKVVRGWLGVTIQDLTPELAKKLGMGATVGSLVSEAFRGSPAEKAGIRRGDIITGVGGKDVESPSSLRNLVAQSRPGTQLSITVLRKGKPLTLRAVVGDPPQADQEKAEPAPSLSAKREVLSGLSVMTLTDDIARQLGLGSDVTGVVVIGVAEGAPADESGIRRGDIIQEVDGAEITNLERFQRITGSRDPREPALLYINRSGRHFYALVPSS